MRQGQQGHNFPNIRGGRGAPILSDFWGAPDLPGGARPFWVARGGRPPYFAPLKVSVGTAIKDVLMTGGEISVFIKLAQDIS